MRALAPIEIGRAPDCIKQRLLVDRLLDAIDSSFPHCLDSDRNVAAAGNEYHRCKWHAPSDLRHKLQAVNSRQADIGDDAIVSFRMKRPKETLGRSINSNLVPRSVELERESFAEVLIVVNESEADGTRRSYFNPGNLHTFRGTTPILSNFRLSLLSFFRANSAKSCSTGFYATNAPFLAMRKMPESSGNLG